MINPTALVFVAILAAIMLVLSMMGYSTVVILYVFIIFIVLILALMTHFRPESEVEPPRKRDGLDAWERQEHRRLKDLDSRQRLELMREVLGLIENKGSVRFDDLMYGMKTTEAALDSVLKVLEKRNGLRVHYPPVGYPLIWRVKETYQLRSKIDARISSAGLDA